MNVSIDIPVYCTGTSHAHVCIVRCIVLELVMHTYDF